MRKFVTGVNPAGQSCIVDEQEIETAAIPGVSGVKTAALFSTTQTPPTARPEQTGHFIDVRLPPGIVRWIVVDHAPHSKHDAPTTASEMHHSDTLDLIIVVDGSQRLILQADERMLVPGDCVVMNGVDHAFETGPDGCRVISVAVGTPPPG